LDIEGFFFCEGGKMAKIKTGPKVKRKGGGVAAKSVKVDALANDFAGASTMIVTEYRGLKVQELQDLRRKLRPRGVEYHVVKNTLFARAAEKAGRGGMRSLLVGPTAVAVPSSGADEVELAKSLVEETRAFKAFRIMGAFVSGRAMTAEDVQALAKLPGRAQLQAQLVGTLQSPLASVTGVLQAPLANLIHVFNSRGAAAH
jgi:large subunit ribosomal protein L10